MTDAIFQELVQDELKHIGELFQMKNDQYKTNDDPLANFTAGAMLRYKSAALPAQYETLKDYVAKHIAHIYNNDLDGQKVSESLQDIVVYFIIARVMSKKHNQDGVGK